MHRLLRIYVHPRQEICSQGASPSVSRSGPLALTSLPVTRLMRVGSGLSKGPGDRVGPADWGTTASSNCLRRKGLPRRSNG